MTRQDPSDFPVAPPPLPGEIRLFSRDQQGSLVAWNATVIGHEEQLALVIDILQQMGYNPS